MTDFILFAEGGGGGGGGVVERRKQSSFTSNIFSRAFFCLLQPAVLEQVL